MPLHKKRKSSIPHMKGSLMVYVLIGLKGNALLVNFAVSPIMSHQLVTLESFVTEVKLADFHMLMQMIKCLF